MAKQLNVNLAFTADTSQAAAQVRNLQTQLTNLINQPVGIGTKMTAEIQSAVSAAAELKVHLQNATNVKTGTLDFGRLNQSLKASGTSLSQYAAKLQSIGPQGQQAFMSLARSVANAEVPLRRSNALLQQFGTTLANTARWQLSSSLLHGFISSVSTAWRYSQDLNESLNNIRIVTGKNIEEMSRFADQANRAAKALSTTTTEYTNASLIYYQQGLSDAEVLGRTETTIKMANASRQSAEIVSDQMTAIWNNFYDGSKSLEYYADVVTALGAATASSSEEIATGLEKFAAVAETVGLSYEYATSALATITATTRQSADIVGTALKTLFARLSDLKLGETLEDGTTLGQYSENLAKIGVNIKDASGQLKDMDTILNETAAKWDTLDRAQQTALAKGVAGIRQYTQFIALMDNWDFMEKNLATASGSTGTLQKQADIYAESWEAARDRVTAALETIYASIMDDEFFIDLTNGFADLIDGVGGFVKSIGGLQGVLSGLGFILTKVFSEQLTTGFANLAYNIKMSTEAGREMVAQQREAELTKMTSLMADYDAPTNAGRFAQQVYKEELTLQNELLHKSKELSQEQIQQYQHLIQGKQVMGEQVIELGRQLDKLQDIRMAQQSNLTGHALQSGKDSTAIQDAFKTANAEMGELGKIDAMLKQIYNGANVAGEEFNELGQLINTALKSDAGQRLITDLKGMQVGSEEVKIAINKIQGELQELALNATDSLANKLGITKGTEQYRELRSAVEEYITTARKEAEVNHTATSAKKNNEDQTRRLTEEIRNATAATQSMAQSLTAVVSGLMSAGMLISSINGLMDTIANPDLSGWERFGQVLTSVSMIVFSLMGAWKGLTAIVSVAKTAFTTDTVAVLANSWAKKQAQKEEEKLAAIKAKGTIIQRIKSALNKDEIADDTKDATTTNAAAAAQEKENAEIRENIALELARKKMGLRQETGLDGTTRYYRQGKDGSWTRIRDKQYNNLLQQGRAGVTDADIDANMPQSPTGKTKFDPGTLKTLGKGIGRFAAGAAAIALVAGTIAIAVNQFNAHNEAAKKATEQAKEAATAYEAVNQAYTDFASKTDAYKDAKKGLSELTKGTEEYEDAILKANEAAMDLLNSYEGLQYTINEDGLIIIDETSLQEAKKLQQQALKNAQTSNLIAQRNAKNKQIEADSVNFQRDKLRSNNNIDTNEEIGNVLVGAGVGVGATALGAIALGAVAGPIGLLIGGIVGLTAAVIANTATGNANAEEADALNRLATVYAEQGNAKFASDAAFRKLLTEELKIDDKALIDSLVANREATAELAKEMAAANAQEKAQNAAELYSKYENQLTATGLNEDVAHDVTEVAATKLKELEDKLYNETYKDGFGNLTDAEVQKQYAQMMGYATETIENMYGNKAKYYNKDGTEVGVIADDVARRYLAHAKAVEQMGGSITELSNLFTKLSQSGNALDSAILKWSADKNTGAFTSDEYQAMVEGFAGDDKQFTEEEVRKMIESTMTPEQAALLGIDLDNLSGFVDALNKFPEQLENVINSFTPEVQDAVAEIEESSGGLSKNAQAAIGKQIGDVQKTLGDDAAQQLTDIYKQAGPEAEKLNKVLSTIDWSTATPDTLSKALIDAGVSTNYSTNALQQLCDTMYSISDVSNITIAELLQNLEKVKNLKQGDTVEADVYNKLTDEMKSYFTYMADGTYQLTQDALDFYQLTNDKQKIWQEHTVNAMARMAELQAFQGSEDDLAKYSTPLFELAAPDTSTDAYNRHVNFLFAKEGMTREDSTYEGRNDQGQDIYKGIGITKENGAEQKTLEIDTYDTWKQEQEATYQNWLALNAKNSLMGEGKQEALAAQLDLLSKSSYGKDNTEQVTEWLNKMQDGTMTNQDLADITAIMKAQGPALLEEVQKAYETTREDAIKGFAGQLQNASSAEDREALYNQATQLGFGEEVKNDYINAQMAAINEEKYEDIDLAAVDSYAESLMNAAEASDLLDDSLKNNKEAAEDVALYTTKMNKGIDKLANGFEDWNSILKQSDKSSEEYNKAMSEMKDAMSDVLGVEEDFLSDDFILENMDKIEKAAKGDAEAIDALAIAAGQSILINIAMGNEALEKDLLALQDTLLNKIPKDIKVGATLDAADFTNAANELVNTANMSVEEAQAYFNSLGYEPVFETHEETVPLKGTKTYTDNVVVGTTALNREGTEVPFQYIAESTTHTEEVDTGKTQSIEVPTLSAEGVPKIKSVRKKSSGSMSNYSSSNKGGKAPSGGGGGGGSKKKTKDKEIERYHKINKTLEYLKASYDAIGKARERAFGQDKLNYLQQEQAILEQELAAQQQYLQEAEAFYQQDRKVLADYGGEFNEQGVLTNYDALMESYIEQFNTGKIDEEAYNAFKEAISKYETTWQKWIDQSAAVVDAENALLDKKLETVQAKVDLNISLSEDQMEWLEYQLENIEDAAYGAAEALALMVQQASQLMTQSSTYQEGIAELLGNHGITDTEAFFSNPDSWSQYNFTEAEIEKLRDYRSNLMSVNKELMGLKDEAISQVTSAFDEWNAKVDENIEKLEHNASILESFKNIVDLVGKDTLGMTDEAMTALAQASVDTATKKLEASRAKYEQSKQAADEVREKMVGLDPESEQYKIFAETLKHIEKETAAAEEEMMSNWESALEAAADAFETAVDNTISSFEKAMAGTFGSLEELQGAFDQSTEISERYVADYKEIYELSKLNRDIMKSMDETDNIKAKQALRDLQEEINELQEGNVQMSEYDLEHLRAKYDLRLAEIALEEAQNAKSQVRMRRDSEGNYSYVFTADESKVAEAQQNYEDKLYEMQELNSEYIKEMQSNILQSEIELANALRELDRTKFASDEEYYAKVNELTNYYTGQRNYYLDETNKGIQNNKELVENDWANYSAATGYKMSADSDYVDSFNETTYAQVAGYNTIQEAQDRFAEATRVMVTDLQTAFTQWQANVDSAMAAAGTSVDQFAGQVDDAINNEEDGILANNEALVESVQDIGEEMAEIFSDETLNRLSTFADKYASTIKPMIDANNELIQSLNTLIAAQAAQTNVGTDPGDIPVDVPDGAGASGADDNSNSSSGNSGSEDDNSDPEDKDDGGFDLGQKMTKYIFWHNGQRHGNFNSAYDAATEAWFKYQNSLINIRKITYWENDPGKLITDDIVNQVKDLIKIPEPSKSPKANSSGRTKDFAAVAFDTGGYTGSWNSDGRLAMLHQKELVLNAEDTKNILGAVDMIRSISHIIDLNAGAQSLGFARLDATRVMGEAEVIKQDVSIYAEFPNAVDHSEIEMAFHNLMNQASQFANRPKI